MPRFLLFLIIVPSVLSAEVAPEVNPEVAPELGAWALEKILAEFGAPDADEKTCFLGLDSIAVFVLVDKNIEETISEQRVKDKFELVLRQHGVPLADSSDPYLLLTLDGSWQSGTLLYAIDLSLKEEVFFWRNDEPYRRHVSLWEAGTFGYAGRRVVGKQLLETIEAKAERVTNLYLSANPR